MYILFLSNYFFLLCFFLGGRGGGNSSLICRAVTADDGDFLFLTWRDVCLWIVRSEFWQLARKLPGHEYMNLTKQ